MTALMLARMQFAFTIGCHIIFPSFSIGLASYLAVLNGLSLITGRGVFLVLFGFWRKIFALVFTMGVVSGIVMSYEFGTNWSVFSDRTGPIIGPLMGYEVLSAFFLESGFLGIMLFGRQRVGKVLHFLATLMVALGTIMSAFWILAANSWMQTPAGFAIGANGQFVAIDWWAIVFNPSFPYRLVHMVLAAYLTTAFVVGAVGALHLLRDRGNEAACVMLSMAMWMAAIVTPLQIAAGDQHGLNTLQYQPAKIAAIEGHFDTGSDVPLILFGIPNLAEERMDHVLAIPALGSLILTHSRDGIVRGLREWPAELRPPVAIVFWSFRVMVGIGLAMFGLGMTSLWLRHRRRLHDARRFLRIAVVMGPAGFIAVLAGWITTEVGRQPYAVYGLLTTAHAASPAGASVVGGSLLGFIVVYLAAFGVGIFYILRLMNTAPVAEADGATVRDGGCSADAAGRG